MNATFGVTVSAACNAFLQVSGAEIPRNAGSYGCITTIAPPGSVVNVRFPGPSVGGNTETQPKLVGMLLGALAGAMPERVMAAEGATACNFLFGGIHPDTDEPYAHYHFEASGWGGRLDGDGQSAQNHVHGNCRNTPVEVFETRFPSSHACVRPDPGLGRPGPPPRRAGRAARPRGARAGDHRERDARPRRARRVGPVRRRSRDAARRCSCAGRATIGSEDFCEAFGTASPSKLAGVVLRAGDVVRLESAGGGGFGDPRERDPRARAP